MTSFGSYVDSDSKRLGRCHRPVAVVHDHRTERHPTENLVIGTEETAEAEGVMEGVVLYYRWPLVFGIIYALERLRLASRRRKKKNCFEGWVGLRRLVDVASNLQSQR